MTLCEILINFSNGTETYCEFGRMSQSYLKTPQSSFRSGVVSKMKSKIRKKSPWHSRKSSRRLHLKNDHLFVFVEK